VADISNDDKLFAGTTQKTAVGTTELMAVLFRNPSGSSGAVRIKKMVFTNSHTVSSFIRVRVYVSPTVTSAGTGVTEVALDLGSGNTAVAEMFLTPTISANGTQILDMQVPGGAAGVTQTIDFPDGFDVRANNNVLITAIADGTGRILNTSIIWEEN